jgi:hypothetical protein
VRYLSALVLLIAGVAIFKSAPGPIVRHLRSNAKNSEDFARGLRVALMVRRALGVFGIALAILVALKWVG